MHIPIKLDRSAIICDKISRDINAWICHMGDDINKYDANCFRVSDIFNIVKQSLKKCNRTFENEGVEPIDLKEIVWKEKFRGWLKE